MEKTAEKIETPIFMSLYDIIGTAKRPGSKGLRSIFHKNNFLRTFDRFKHDFCNIYSVQVAYDG